MIELLIIGLVVYSFLHLMVIGVTRLSIFIWKEVIICLSWFKGRYQKDLGNP